MSYVGMPRDREQYGKLMGMIAPEATPTKRVGTDAPIGAAAGGPSAGKSAAEFTKAQQSSPGSVFKRQLAGANISGITSLAEQPLKREAGQEALRVKGEGQQYLRTQEEALSKQPQFKFTDTVKENDQDVQKDYTKDIVNKIAGGGEEFETAQNILSRTNIPVPKLEIGDVKEFTPLQALRGGSVESLIRKEAAGPYTTGMAGLDALLFAKKGGAAQLGQRGIALRATEQAAADAIEKEATEKAQKQAGELVKGQKEQLQKGISAGITDIGDIYTKAPEGQESKLAKAQRELQEKYKGTIAPALAEQKKDIEQRLRAAQDTIANDAWNRASAQAVPTNIAYDPYGNIDWARVGAYRESLVNNDPIYQRQKAAIEGEAGNILRRLLPDYQRVQQGREPVIEGKVPTLGLENIIASEDAAKYNRLQQLLGGQAITPSQADITPASYDKAAIEAAYQNLLTQLR
jgi:hypothetical protein